MNPYLAEFVRRNERPEFIDRTFVKQADFIDDASLLKAALCNRRAGKTYGMGTYFCEVAENNPGVSMLYIALTREEAKRILIKDVMKVIEKKHGIKLKYSMGAELSVTFPNGAVLYLAGADSNENEMKKLFGQKYKLIVIDEAATFKQDLKTLVYEILEPATVDLNGTIVMIGMPSNNTKSFFHDVTTGKDPRWSVHKWRAQDDNPYMREKMTAHIEKLIAQNPLIVETPLFKQQYLGEWFIDLDRLVYKFNESRNLIKQIPESKGAWTYLLSIDLGYEDPTSFTIPAYNEFDRTLYFLKSYKKKGLDITDVANEIAKLEETYDFSHYMIDGSNKQAVEEMKRRHGIPLTPADKTGKNDFIELMNADMIQGNVKVLEGECNALIDEWQTLIWDEKSKKKVENSACPNHCADGGLYGWRKAYNYLSEKFIEKPKSDTDEYMDELLDKLSQRHVEDREKPFWERE